MSNENTPIEDGTEHHYFASFAFGWKTANTRDEAVKGLVDGFRSDVKNIVKNALKKGNPGCYIWTCKVKAPSDARYGINFYQPQDVPIEDGQHHHVTYVTNKQIAYHTGDIDS